MVSVKEAKAVNYSSIIIFFISVFHGEGIWVEILQATEGYYFSLCIKYWDLEDNFLLAHYFWLLESFFFFGVASVSGSTNSFSSSTFFFPASNPPNFPLIRKPHFFSGRPSPPWPCFFWPTKGLSIPNQLRSPPFCSNQSGLLPCRWVDHILNQVIIGTHSRSDNCRSNKANYSHFQSFLF